MEKLIPILSVSDIPQQFHRSSIELLLEYHNLDRPFESYSRAQLLIGMCMDNRKNLHIPDNFAYIIRTGGANLRYSEFKVSYAIAVGGVRAIALIGHSDCGMVNLIERKNKFVQGLVENAGWEHQQAEDHFHHYAPLFEIGNEIDFILSEAKRLRHRYPKILVAPLLFRIEDNKMYVIHENAHDGPEPGVPFKEISP